MKKIYTANQGFLLFIAGIVFAYILQAVIIYFIL